MNFFSLFFLNCTVDLRFLLIKSSLIYCLIVFSYSSFNADRHGVGRQIEWAQKAVR